MARIAKRLIPLLIFALAIMKPPVLYPAMPFDIVFLVVLGAWLAAVASGGALVRPRRTYIVFALYLGALGMSALVTPNLPATAFKLVTQAYLLFLPMLVDQLIENEEELRAAVRAWLAATAVIALVALAGLIDFFVTPEGALYRYNQFQFGTLPTGHYPRIDATFLNANMLCDYLTVSLGMLLVAWRVGWISPRPAAVLLAGTLITLASTISPGLGGVALLVALWLWLLLRDRSPAVGRLALASGILAAVAFVIATAVTPILHKTAPFLIRVPGTNMLVAPSGRWLAWSGSLQTFLSHPLLGKGFGLDPVAAPYQMPDGKVEVLTDAHNCYLSIAAQCGVVGLVGLLFLLFWVLRATRSPRCGLNGLAAVRVGLGMTFLVALAYVGLSGAFEDSRHLWVLLGLFMAARRLEKQEAEAAMIKPARVAPLR